MLYSIYFYASFEAHSILLKIGYEYKTDQTLAISSYFYIEKWTFKIMCEVCYRAKRDKKEAT